MLQLGFTDEPEFDDEEDLKAGASVVIAEDSDRKKIKDNEDGEAISDDGAATDEVEPEKKIQPKPLAMKRFNAYESTDSD